MFELIKQYLKDNGINDFTLFPLGNEGQGSFIKTWGYEIEQPVFTQEEGLLQETKTAKISQCLSYLSSTDWYAIRKADNGTVIPTQIAENRESARTLQDDINACTTIEELNAINIEF